MVFYQGWAQNWAHSFGVHPCSETVFDGHTFSSLSFLPASGEAGDPGGGGDGCAPIGSLQLYVIIWLTQAFPLRGDLRLQLGLVGYDQWQTTDKSGPTLTPAEAANHYKVYALGFATNLMLPERKASVGIK
jgi:hypothetical protein